MVMNSLGGLPVAPRRRHVAAAVVLSAIVVVFYLPEVLGGGSLGEGEGVIYYLPMRAAVADAWRCGHWPLWNPYVSGGMPLLADCQAGAFYPPNLLYLWFDPVVAMNIVVLGGHLVAAWGVVFLLRGYRVSAWAAGVGATAFVFSGFLVAHMGHVSIVNAAVWLPWLCVATHHWCVGGRRGWLVAAALLWAFQFLAGHPQIVVYSAIIVGMQVVALLVRRSAGGWRRIACLALAAAIGLAMCGVQILPTLALSRDTGRALRAPIELFENYRFAIEYTPLLWLPYLFGTQAPTPLHWDWWGDWNFVELAGYVGLLPWMLVPAAACLPGGRVRYGRAWAIIGASHLVLAWNTDTPVGRLLFHVPVYQSFEAAGRHLLGLTLALSICLGVGLDALAEASAEQSRRWARRGAWAVAFGVLAVAIGGIWGYHYAVVHLHHVLGMAQGRPAFQLRPWMQAPWVFLIPVMMTVLSAWALLGYAHPGRRYGRAAVAAVLLIDVAAAAYLCAWRWRQEGMYRIAPPPGEVARLLTAAGAGEGPPRYLLFGPWGDEYALNAQGNMLYRLASLNGYGPLQLRRFREMMSKMPAHGAVEDAALLKESRALDVWSCRFVIVRRRGGDVLPDVLADPARYRLAAAVKDLEAYENLAALPRAWYVDEVKALAGDEAVLAAIRTGRFGDGTVYDPARVALVSCKEDRERLVSSGQTAPASGPHGRTLRWLAYGGDRFRIETRSDREAVIVLAEPFLDGWNAYVDDRELVPVARVDYLLRGVRVPAGTHTLEMRYEPAPVKYGLMMSLGGLAGLMVMAVWPRRRSDGGAMRANVC